ncbi:SpoIIE family protein phosphatase [Cellulomonas hominis]|uniref:SpoIIE family protein phosphatase n=1 Tax=Cellulomonas hominis TaxID=156981 RepID=UPI001C1006F8|nr:SpoIIE family protein phosphatase [Cellulomonas hominis]MBU5423064.1 SpoIIE family protein phosphatase [Cellulomonas hominis]
MPDLPDAPGGPRDRAARRLLSSLRDPALERLAQLAARLLAAPSAQAALIDDVPTAADPTVVGGTGPRTALSDTVCAATARRAAPLVVPDASQPQAGVSPDEHVGAYLGVPLLGRDGHVVGALCVYDGEARAWSEDDVLVLSDLAASAVAELELSALSVEYEADRARRQLAVTAGGVGTFDWDLATGRLDWDDQLLRIFGLDRDAFGGTIEAFDAAVHPDDLPRVHAALDRAVAACEEYTAEYRVRRPDGSTRWVQARGLALAGPDGTAARVLGAAYDTTAARQADARIARVLETMATAFFLLDDAWRFAYVNAEAERVLGRTRGELLGGEIWSLFPFATGSPFEEHYRGAVATGAPRSFEAYYPPPLDGWYEVRAFPGPDGLSVYFHDITARRHAEEQRLAARSAADAATHRLAVLATVSDDLSSTLDTEYAVGRLARHLVRGFGSWCLVTLWDDQRQLRDIAGWHAEPHLRPTVARYAQLRLGSLAPSSFLHRALHDGELVTVDDATEQISPLLTGEARDVLRSLAPRRAHIVPMRARGRTVGAISLFLDAMHADLGPEDLALLVQVADRAGVALDNARLFEGQRRMAETLQRALLTAPAQPEDLDVVVRYVPAAEAAQVGGDWYDAFLQPDGATVLVIGDVMGHDRHAAAAMSQVRTLLRGIAATSGGPPAQVLGALDTTLETLRVDAMASAVVLRLEQSDEDRAAATTTVRWTNAGHLPPLLVDPEGTVRELRGGDPELVLGVTAGAARTDATVSVPRGSTVVLYTDGLVEQRGEHLQDGIDRLAELVAALVPEARERATGGAVLDAAYLADAVLSRGAAGDAPEDDIALLVVHLRPQAP